MGLTLVQEYQKQRVSFFQSQVTNISDLYFQENIVTGTFATPEAFGGIGENGLASYLGRVNYNYAGKYYLSGSIRRDALSSLAPGNRVGYFPGVSFAYRMSEESYWESLKDMISDFRIRGSYAQTGNTNIGNYPYIGSYGSGLYGTQNGIAYNNFGNDQLKWESQTKTDVGVDLGFKTTDTTSVLRTGFRTTRTLFFRHQQHLHWVYPTTLSIKTLVELKVVV